MHIRHLHPRRGFRFIYVAALLLSIHYASTVYINSTFLSQFISEKSLGILYTVGSVVTLIGFVIASHLIKKMGNFAFILSALVLEMIALLGLAFAHDVLLLQTFFVFHQALPVLLIFSLDIFLESSIRKETSTGSIRSSYLTMMNIAFVISPIIIGRVVASSSYQTVYIISAFFCAVLFLIITDKFRSIKTHSFKEIEFIDSVRKLSLRSDLSTIFTLSFLLHCFYVVMVIYTPIYLNKVIGFDWPTIGTLFTIMLLPFVIFEAPLGRTFDKVHSVRDTLIAGYIIMIISVICIFFLDTPNFWLWALVLFMSRTGASFVEIASEYAFFRRVTDRDAGFISVLRSGSPLAYIVAPITASAIVAGLSISHVFLAVAVILLFGIGLVYKFRHPL